MDQIFNKLEVNKSLRLSLLVDYNRGHCGKNHTSVHLCQPLKANFMPNSNVRIGFYKAPNIFNPNGFRIQEIRGVQHMKICVFDDHVLLTGANLSDNYFTEREDRWILFKNNPQLADYCDDLANTMIDISYQMDDEGVLIVIYKQRPRNLPKNRKKFISVAKNRMDLFKYMQEDMPGIVPPEEPSRPADAEKDIQVYTEAPEQIEKLKKTLKSEDIFNILKDMPHDLNIVTGDGGWKNEVTVTGSTVYLFPALQLYQYGCNDDFQYLSEILPKFENLAISSGYMAFPPQIARELCRVKKLSLLSASPHVFIYIG